MQRAAELALYYDHTRPDGSDCFTAFSGSYKAENIAVGYTSAAAVFNGWLEENASYSGQGHRRNMLDKNVTAIGIGHVRCGSYDYWTMELRNSVGSTAPTPAAESKQKVSVNVDSSYIESVVISAPCEDVLLIGETASLIPEFYLKGKRVNNYQGQVPVDAEFTVTSGSPSLLEITGSNGNYSMYAKAEGTSTVTVAGESSYGKASVSFDVTIGRVDLAYAQITLDQTSYPYQGEPVCPKPVVTYKGKVLEEGVDYTLTYARNTKVTRNTGSANVAAIGINKYKGMIAESFEITQADIADLNPHFSKTAYFSNGRAIEPKVIISGLTENVDYHVEYSNNYSAGTATARVVGWGNYKGEVYLKFTIVSSAKPSTPVISKAVNVKGKKIRVTWKKQTDITGYQLRYKTGSTTKKINVKASAVKKVISKLKKGKKYTITLRSYKKTAAGTLYSSWSAAKKVKIKK